jgi:hypothetical protein
MYYGCIFVPALSAQLVGYSSVSTIKLPKTPARIEAVIEKPRLVIDWLKAQLIRFKSMEIESSYTRHLLTFELTSAPVDPR